MSPIKRTSYSLQPQPSNMENLDPDIKRWLERTGYHDGSIYTAASKAWRRLDVFDAEAEKKLAALDGERARQVAANEAGRGRLLKEIGALHAFPSGSKISSRSNHQHPSETGSVQDRVLQKASTPSEADTAHHAGSLRGPVSAPSAGQGTVVDDRSLAPSTTAGDVEMIDENLPISKHGLETSRGSCLSIAQPCKLVVSQWFTDCIYGIN